MINAPNSRDEENGNGFATDNAVSALGKVILFQVRVCVYCVCVCVCVCIGIDIDTDIDIDIDIDIHPLEGDGVFLMHL